MAHQQTSASSTSWFRRLRESLSTRGHERQRVSEQYSPTLWNYTGNISEDDYAWRSLSDNAYQKDLVPSAYLEMHNQAYEAYHANPLAFAIIETTTSFVLGRGIKLDASHKRVQRVLNDFWQANNMDERVYAISNELALYGELFVRYFANLFDGNVKVRLTDPSLIDQIETDPEDVETPLRFHRRPLGDATEGVWFQAGSEMQHFAINKVSNARRGNSDLTPLLPWLRRYKDWLTDRVRINKYKGAFLWDVTLRGADRKTIDMKRMEYAAPPPSGSVLIHNDAAKNLARLAEVSRKNYRELHGKLRLWRSCKT